jgi:hypothetical protein
VQLERERGGYLGLVEVSDVVDEGVLGAGADEAEGGGAAHCEDCGVDDAVQAHVRGGQGQVDRVLGVPGVRVVVAPEPGDAVLLGEQLIQRLDALAFDAAQLGEVRAGRDVVAEPVQVDPGGNSEPLLVIGPGPGLAFQPVGGQ